MPPLACRSRRDGVAQHQSVRLAGDLKAAAFRGVRAEQVARRRVYLGDRSQGDYALQACKQWLRSTALGAGRTPSRAICYSTSERSDSVCASSWPSSCLTRSAGSGRQHLHYFHSRDLSGLQRWYRQSPYSGHSRRCAGRRRERPVDRRQLCCHADVARRYGRLQVDRGGSAENHHRTPLDRCNVLCLRPVARG